MSARGEAPAPLADALALLEPGDDVFFFADREGLAIAARGAAIDSGTAPVFFLGACPFEESPARGHFRPYARIATADFADAPRAPIASRLRGSLDAAADREAWRSLVSRALTTIESGAASKIVCARTVRLHAERPVEAGALARAMLHTDGTYRYLMRRGDVVFAGATPERLIEKRGDTIRTEAVAGTAPLEHDDTPLEEREKDRREHLAVVLAIEEALAPLTLALEHADQPLVRRVGRVQHLVTPFEGRIDPATHVLDLAAALHPTPAVAGTPRDAALDFIAREEGMRRGWYAGPIGWLDANGDGELAVALRCVRIEGTAVDLFAGAGIVAGSDPDAEFDETVLKMRSTLVSLGFELAA